MPSGYGPDFFALLTRKWTAVGVLLKFPRAGSPIVDKLIGNLRETARETTDEAIERAADVIRTGDRTHLVIVLSGAVFLGWLLAHQSHR